MLDVLENRLLAGRYQLISKLGQGGMGTVWCAHDRHLRIQVAVKLLDPNIADDEEAQARFQREALAAAQLRSTHIVHITDHGIDGDTPFIAMELLEGESLGARLRRLGKLPHAETVQILSQVARALTVAHTKGIAHRDLKPENVFIVCEGDVEIVKVLDFGIAKRLDARSYSDGVKTRTGALLGTPFYMSPEQAHGKGRVDQRTDIWSFGVIAYQCITGRRPFEEDTLAALLLAICSEAPPTPSRVAEVPDGFDDWFARATSRDLDQRFSTASEAAQALATLGKPESAHPNPATPPIGASTTAAAAVSYVETVNPSSRTNPGNVSPTKVSRATVFSASLLAAAALGGLGFWLFAPPSPSEPAAMPEILAATPTQVPQLGRATSGAAVPSATMQSAVSAAPANTEPAQVTPLTLSSVSGTPTVQVPTVPSSVVPRKAPSSSFAPKLPPSNAAQASRKPQVETAASNLARTPAPPRPVVSTQSKTRDYARF